jgi:hypothetical protein
LIDGHTPGALRQVRNRLLIEQLRRTERAHGVRIGSSCGRLGSADARTRLPKLQSKGIFEKNREFGWFFLEFRGGASLDSPSLARSCEVIDGSIDCQSVGHRGRQCKNNGFR